MAVAIATMDRFGSLWPQSASAISIVLSGIGMASSPDRTSTFSI